MRVLMRDLRVWLREAAMTSSSLPANVRIAEMGNKWSHYIYLVDADKMPDIEAALLGGISVTEYRGPWGVGSVCSFKGYGPLLYRLAMEWVRENARGRGLTKNRGGETSDAAKRVWSRFDTDKQDVKLVGDPGDGEYVATSHELDRMQNRSISLTKDQAAAAWNMLTSLEIGGQRGYEEEEA